MYFYSVYLPNGYIHVRPTPVIIDGRRRGYSELRIARIDCARDLLRRPGDVRGYAIWKMTANHRLKKVAAWGNLPPLYKSNARSLVLGKPEALRENDVLGRDYEHLVVVAPYVVALQTPELRIRDDEKKVLAVC